MAQSFMAMAISPATGGSDFAKLQFLYGLAPPFFRADADAFFQRGNEYFTITNLPFPIAIGFRRLDNGIAGNIHKVIVDRDIQTHLGNQVGNYPLAAIDAFFNLLAMPGHTAYGDPGDFRVDQGFPYPIQLFFPYDSCYQFHAGSFLSLAGA
jgi:hypothetical protein